MALRLREVVATSSTVAATSSRTAKVAALADLFARASLDELPVVVAMLAGTPRQGRIGVGWATLSAVASAVHGEGGVRSVIEFDRLLDELAALAGDGAHAARTGALEAFLSAADGAERELLQRVLAGGLRQGANEGLVVEGLARATAIPASELRRALMLCGDLGETARVARRGGAEALRAERLQVGRALRPMLAATSASVAEAVGELGAVSVEWKLDGARVQVHRDGADVAIFTRNLNDITARLPEVARLVTGFGARRFVLDGELIGLTEDDADRALPQLFQDTISRFATDRAAPGSLTLSPFFFDCLHADGEDLLDEPLAARLAVLDHVAGAHAVARLVTSDAAAAQAFAEDALARRHEGVMVKSLDGVYRAGRRGASWRKVKPVRTLDLVVLAAEWGHGRRHGLLSNLHLGARDPGRPGQFVMVGKTFKGLTDEMLRRQTDELLARETGRSAGTVTVSPELVVEIALDGVQRSRRYPGGVALRFARVRRYRPDKSPAQADTIDTVAALLAAPAAG